MTSARPTSPRTLPGCDIRSIPFVFRVSLLWQESFLHKSLNQVYRNCFSPHDFLETIIQNKQSSSVPDVAGPRRRRGFCQVLFSVFEVWMCIVKRFATLSVNAVQGQTVKTICKRYLQWTTHLESFYMHPTEETSCTWLRKYGVTSLPCNCSRFEQQDGQINRAFSLAHTILVGSCARSPFCLLFKSIFPPPYFNYSIKFISPSRSPSSRSFLFSLFPTFFGPLFHPPYSVPLPLSTLKCC